MSKEELLSLRRLASLEEKTQSRIDLEGKIESLINQKLSEMPKDEDKEDFTPKLIEAINKVVEMSRKGHASESAFNGRHILELERIRQAIASAVSKEHHIKDYSGIGEGIIKAVNDLASAMCKEHPVMEMKPKQWRFNVNRSEFGTITSIEAEEIR